MTIVRRLAVAAVVGMTLASLALLDFWHAALGLFIIGVIIWRRP